MPLKIIATPNDPHNSRRVVYVPDPHDARRDRPRPLGRYMRCPETGRGILRPRPDEPVFFVGLDLAQSNDWTALVILERGEAGCAVRAIERVQGVPYTRIVARMAELMEAPPLAGRAELVVDATGVGASVVDMLRVAKLSPVAVTITGGQKVNGGGKRVTVPKVDLIEGVMVALEAEALTIDDVPNRTVLVRELAELRRAVTAGGRVKYEARTGEHDDVVLALAIALWQAERGRLRPGVIRVTTIEGGAPDPTADRVRRELSDFLR